VLDCNFCFSYRLVTRLAEQFPILACGDCLFDEILRRFRRIVRVHGADDIHGLLHHCASLVMVVGEDDWAIRRLDLEMPQNPRYQDLT
jgi:hypothetical protein